MENQVFHNKTVQYSGKELSNAEKAARKQLAYILYWFLRNPETDFTQREILSRVRKEQQPDIELPSISGRINTLTEKYRFLEICAPEEKVVGEKGKRVNTWSLHPDTYSVVRLGYSEMNHKECIELIDRLFKIKRS